MQGTMQYVQNVKQIMAGRQRVLALRAQERERGGSRGVSGVALLQLMPQFGKPLTPSRSTMTQLFSITGCTGRPSDSCLEPSAKTSDTQPGGALRSHHKYSSWPLSGIMQQGAFCRTSVMAWACPRRQSAGRSRQ